MTADTTPHPGHVTRPPQVGARLFAGTADGPVLDLSRHRHLHGPLERVNRETLVHAASHVGLLGRGGAGFPVSVKLSSTRPGARTEVVVNLSEGEPASHKDRVLASNAPHLVLDGALLVADALRTRRVTVAVHDTAVRRIVAAAVRERPDAAHVEVVGTPGGFVAGEVRALLNGLEGGPGVPPGRRQIPSVSGLHDRPTFVSNAETFAHLGLLGSHGRDWYGDVGAPAERGTTLLTLLGQTVASGVVEVPLGTPLHQLVKSSVGPVLIGGYHGTWLPQVGDLTLDRADLRDRGLHLGAGVIAALPIDTCALAEVAVVARWLASQSVGQCGPCFFGLPAVASDIDALLRGRLPEDGLQALRRRLGQLPGRGACGHPDGAAMFIRSALDVLQTEVAQHLANGTCGRPYGGTLPTEPTTS
jgi:NADH:ubiquinone oxidoreductase subunit F (NADH-binding)